MKNIGKVYEKQLILVKKGKNAQNSIFNKLNINHLQSKLRKTVASTGFRGEW